MNEHGWRPRIVSRIVATCLVFFFVTALLPAYATGEVQSITLFFKANGDDVDGRKTPHRSYLDTTAVRRNQLLVFLPGTGGRNLGPPRPFSQTAAELGYHVIELAYPNEVPATVCWRVPDPSCFEGFRREIITGEDTSPLISVKQSDSIENRLQKVLAVLSKRQPAKGWDQYLGGAGLVWEKVVLAGQSQGGGHAALIARDHRVARVLLFGAPKDYDPRRQKPAAWYRPGSTPANRFFALVHTGDEQGCTFPQQLGIYKAMGIDARQVDVDIAPAPFGNARILVTSYPGKPIPSKMAHTLGLSNPRFKPVWTYMLTADDNTSDREE